MSVSCSSVRYSSARASRRFRATRALTLSSSTSAGSAMVSFTSATTSDDPPKATVVLTNGSRDLYEGSQHLAFGEVRRLGSADWEGRRWFGYAALMRRRVPAVE